MTAAVTTRPMAASTRAHRRRARPLTIARRVLFTVLVLVIAVASVGPFVWQALSSFEPDSLLNSRTPVIVSAQFTLSHYASVFVDRGFQAYIVNSVIVSISSTVIALVLAVACAYALTRLPLPGKALILSVTLGLSMFPQISIVTPLYLILNDLHLLDTYSGLTGAYIGLSLPLMIFIICVYLRTIPEELDEAASIDGAGRIRTLFSVLIPLASPGIVTAFLLGFIANWNEFLLALSFETTPEHQTIPVGIANFQGQYFIPWGDMAAASVVVTIPLVLIVLVFQRRLVEGITAGGVKE